MKPKTRLSSAVFQLTPTRTRCDLIIIANDKREKIASGLLNPFLAHLKTAQDQIAKGGYSILLEPEAGIDAPWFTKFTLERFVRFVSTPEILERVYTIETEILQIDEAIALQSRNDIEQSTVENLQRKSLGGHEGDKSAANANDDKAIVLYTPGSQPSEANGSCSQEDNSKVQLLKVLETRKTALQKEQGMAFARAVAAGFDIDHMAPLVSFAECFGAMRLMEACSKFRDVWKRKQETGQWLDIEASETLYTQPDFSTMKASNKQDESELTSEHNTKPGSTNSADNSVSNGQQEYFQGQFPHLVFPSWPMHAPPGAQPLFPAYPVQGMPYYQNYSGNGPFVQPHQSPLEHSQSSFSPHLGQNRQPHDVRDSNDGSETREIDRTSSLDDTASETEVSYSRKPRKKVSKKKSGMVVIRNINYITSKEKKSGSETNSESYSDVDTENEGDGEDEIHQSRSSKSGGSQLKSVGKLNFNNNEVSISGKDTDDRHWQAFQDCLLRGNDGDRAEMQDNSMKDIHRMSGSTSRMTRGSGEEVLFSSVDNGYRGSNYQSDIQFAETNGRKNLFRSGNDDFMIGSRQSPGDFNPSDPLDASSFQGGSSKKDRDSSPGMADESLIIPFRSISLDQTDRTAIDIDSEIPSKYQKSGSEGNKNRVNYEPNDLSLMPERGTDGRSIEYNPALDYEMQVCAEVSEKRGGKDVTNVKGGLKKPDKDRKSTGTMGSLQKQRTCFPFRKGNPSKMSPLEDARARAEKLRSYKADLLKMKKEQEAAEAKRLEALKLQRQKRIAARGGTTSGKPSTLSPQTKQLPAKLSPATNRGSKFSDSEPGSSSPLQRSKIRTSLGLSEPNKASKASKLSERPHIAGNRLTRSSSSLSETKTGVTPESKASMSRIRRLSAPKAITNSPVITMKPRSAEAVLKRKKTDGPDKSKVSSIINLDRSKAATLPELKIKTPKSSVNTSAVKNEQKVDADENPIIEKIVVVESGKPSLPLNSSEGKPKVWNQLHNDHEIGEQINVIHARTTPFDGVDREPIQKQSDYKEVKTAYSEKDPPNFATSEQLYRAPHARVSSMEDPSTRQTEYGKAPLASSGMLSIAEGAVKAHVPNIKALEMGKKQITPEKKESSKGLRRLLKFGGKKNHTSSSVEQSVDSESTSELNNSTRKMASTGEVPTLKNLILQDETSADGNPPQKTSRHFSLLSPFRIKTSEKKQAL